MKIYKISYIVKVLTKQMLINKTGPQSMRSTRTVVGKTVEDALNRLKEYWSKQSSFVKYVKTTNCELVVALDII